MYKGTERACLSGHVVFTVVTWLLSRGYFPMSRDSLLINHSAPRPDAVRHASLTLRVTCPPPPRVTVRPSEESVPGSVSSLSVTLKHCSLRSSAHSHTLFVTYSSVNVALGRDGRAAQHTAPPALPLTHSYVVWTPPPHTHTLGPHNRATPRPANRSL